MKTALLLTLAFNLLAADVTIRIDRSMTNLTIITITLPEVQQIKVQTNEAPAALDNSERLWGEIHEKEQRLLSIMKDVVRMLTNAIPNVVQPVARSVIVPPDAMASLPRAIPTPPMPPPWVPPGYIKDWDRGDSKAFLESLRKDGPGGVAPPKVRWKKIDAPWLTSLPDGTNSYSEHVDLWNKEKAERGLRRGE